MTEPAKVFEDRTTPGQWRVAWIGGDGCGELQVFTGPTARRDALRYAIDLHAFQGSGAGAEPVALVALW